MAKALNLSLRRKLQTAQNVPEVTANVVLIELIGSDLKYTFDLPLTSGSGTMTGTAYAGSPVYGYFDFPLTRVSDFVFSGPDPTSGAPELAWLKDSGNWRTPSNGKAAGLAQYVL